MGPLEKSKVIDFKGYFLSDNSFAQMVPPGTGIASPTTPLYRSIIGYAISFSGSYSLRKGRYPQKHCKNSLPKVSITVGKVSQQTGLERSWGLPAYGQTVISTLEPERLLPLTGSERGIASRAPHRTAPECRGWQLAIQGRRGTQRGSRQ